MYEKLVLVIGNSQRWATDSQWKVRRGLMDRKNSQKIFVRVVRSGKGVKLLCEEAKKLTKVTRRWSLGTKAEKQLSTAAGRENTRADVLGSTARQVAWSATLHHSCLPLQPQHTVFTSSSRPRICAMDSKFPSNSSPVSKLTLGPV